MAGGQEFANVLRSLEQYIQTVKGQNNLLIKECFFNLFLEVFIYNKVEQLEFKLENITGIQKNTIKVRKGYSVIENRFCFKLS